MDPNKACWYCGKEAEHKLLNSGHLICSVCAKAKRVPVVPVPKPLGTCAVCGGWPSFGLMFVLVGIGMFFGAVAAVLVMSPVGG